MFQKSAAQLTAAFFLFISFLPAAPAHAAQPGSAHLSFAGQKGLSAIRPVTETARLSIETDSSAYNNFSAAVAMDNNTVVVADCSGVYVFEKPAGGWVAMTQTARLTASDNVEFFAGYVAISGDTIAVGVPALIGGTLYQGIIYVFVKPAGGWQDMTETAKLTTSNAGQLDFFGRVAISGDTVAVGAPYAESGRGAVYVFVKPDSGWTTMTETARLMTSDNTSFDLGESVAISGETVIAGAHFDTFNSQTSKGSAYVFEKPAAGWIDMTQTAKLTASDGQVSDRFGVSVAVSGSTVVVGSPYADIGAHENQGAAYVYEKPAGGWADMTETGKLTASDGAAQDVLGMSVAASGTLVAAGASHYPPNPYQRSAYVFLKPAGGWQDMTQDLKLRTSQQTNDFGGHVAACGNMVVAGAAAENTVDEGPGSAYVFDLNEIPGMCPAVQLYGADAVEVKLLRRFRDSVLEKNALGRLSARLYYRLAPAAASMLDASPSLRTRAKQAVDMLLPALKRYMEQ